VDRAAVDELVRALESKTLGQEDPRCELRREIVRRLGLCAGRHGEYYCRAAVKALCANRRLAVRVRDERLLKAVDEAIRGIQTRVNVHSLIERTVAGIDHWIAVNDRLGRQAVARGFAQQRRILDSLGAQISAHFKGVGRRNQLVIQNYTLQECLDLNASYAASAENYQSYALESRHQGDKDTAAAFSDLAESYDATATWYREEAERLR
jgi:hypothetical protein